MHRKSFSYMFYCICLHSCNVFCQLHLQPNDDEDGRHADQTRPDPIETLVCDSVYVARRYRSATNREIVGSVNIFLIFLRIHCCEKARFM